MLLLATDNDNFLKITVGDLYWGKKRQENGRKQDAGQRAQVFASMGSGFGYQL